MIPEFDDVRLIDVLYRVSTRAQEKEGESLFNQRRTVEEEWAQPRGIEVRHRIQVAESGTSALRLRGAGFEFSRRLEYRDLIVGYQNGGARPDAVCVDWSDRWSRNLMEFIGLIEAFRALRIRLLCIGEGIDLTDRRSQLVAAIKSAVAQEQVRVTSDKVRENRRSRRERARWQGGRQADGYRTHKPECPGRSLVSRLGPDGKAHQFSVRSCSCPPDVLFRDPERESTVIAIWDLLLRSPLSWGGLAEAINQKGYVRRDGRPFIWNDLYRMGENPHYAGIMTTDRWDDHVAGESKQHRPLENQSLRPTEEAIVDPYISEDDFWRFHKERYRGHRRHLRRSRRGCVSELSGILVCPGCEGVMDIFYTLSNLKCGSGALRKAPRKRYVYARCPLKAPSTACKFIGRRFPLVTVSENLIQKVAALAAMSDASIAQALQMQPRKLPKKTLQRERLAMETTIYETDITRRFLQQERAVGRVDDAEYQRDLFDLRQKVNTAKRRLAEIDNALATTHAAVSFAVVRETVSWLAGKWGALTVLERAEALRLLISRLTIDADGVPRILEFGPGFVESATRTRLHRAI